MPKEVVISGSIAWDDIIVVNHNLFDECSNLHPEFSLSLLAKEKKLFPGGTGANIAYTYLLLGGTPILLASLGKEDEKYQERLKKWGLRTEYLHLSTEPTASFTVITDSGNRQFGVFHPGAMLDSQSLNLQPWKNKNAIICVSPNDPNAMLRQINQCRKLGLDLFFDPGQQINNTIPYLLENGILAAKYLATNESELDKLAKKLSTNVDALLSLIPVCITTLGKKGALIRGREIESEITIPAAKIDKLVDPTGAGDAWRAAFLYAIAHGFDLKTAGQMGAVAAAFAVEAAGGQGHSFTKDQFVKRYEKEFK